jgi:hypothetical protein
MLFMRAMFVVMLVLDCLVCVYGVALEDHSTYQTCIANPATCTDPSQGPPRWYASCHPPPCMSR